MDLVPERYNASRLIDRNLDAGRAEKVAITCGDEQITYDGLARRINRVGHGLRQLGIRREERVLLVLNDTPAFPVSFFGAMRLGAVPVPLNTLLKPADYRFLLEDSEARAIIVDAEHYARVRAAIDGDAGLTESVAVIVANGRAEDAHALDDLLAAGGDWLTPADTHRDDAAFWLYSSGSTGRPKGVVHLHHDILYTCQTYARHVLGITQDDTVFSASKLFHAYGLGNAISFPYWAGASTVLYPGRPEPRAVLETITRYRPTLFFTVPTLYNAILAQPEAASYDLSSVRLCVSAGEALPPGVWRRWKETFGVTILDGIGSTEMLHIFLSNTPDALKPGSSGRPVPGYQAKILDEAGDPVAPGEAGYLYVQGDSAGAYYWRNHEKTKRTMVGAWLFTGDWYRTDDDGFYWYEGRADDMIKVGGLWVSPVDVENTLGQHPAVLEAAVVGVPVEGLTRLKACVTLRAGHVASPALAQELQTWCKERLQRYQYPHIVDFYGELPKTVTGKVQRFMLREPRTDAVGVATAVSTAV
jgi:benzoate-CoA ligase family protein